MWTVAVGDRRLVRWLSGAGLDLSTREVYDALMGHFLTSRAKLYERPNTSNMTATHSFYDVSRGGWVEPKNNGFLVKSESEECYLPRTKKDDIETGEDQKGE